MEALRERDLIFARLLQYKAFKRAGDDFRARLLANSGRYPHTPGNDHILR
jgi:segregation and condensation protein A